MTKYYATYAGWKRAAKKLGAPTFYGDKDIGGFSRFNTGRVSVAGEWDGEKGEIWIESNPCIASAGECNV